MQHDIERVLIERGTIAERLDALADQIAADVHADRQAESADGDGDGVADEITLLPILTGSVIFLADLMRRLPMLMQIHIVSVSSYPGAATTSLGPSIESDLTHIPEDLSRRHVLVIDDILDSGRTLQTVKALLAQRQPASLRTCVLLRKERAEALECPVDYVAFDIPDRFVVGYGLDFDGYYRNLPDIVTLKPAITGE